MIDIENKVLNDVFDAVKSAFPNCQCYGEYVSVPASFPCICMYESDSETYTWSNDEQKHEHQARVTYECYVYSDKAGAKKAESKAIADVVDRAMQNMLFVRTFRSQIPNQDRTIHRVMLRWQAVVGEPITESDGNITYRMYRDRVR